LKRTAAGLHQARPKLGGQTSFYESVVRRDVGWENALGFDVLPTAVTFDVTKVRADFPALGQQVHGHPLVYLDHAATAQKPRAVMEALRHFYEFDCANIHRGVHELSERATEAYEAARIKAQRFLNARRNKEIVFVRGATEGINLVAATWGRKSLKEGDEIVVSTLEHHSNIVPWQALCEEKGAILKWIPINDRGELMLEEYEKLLGPRTRMVAVAHVSNTLGTVNPVRQMAAMAHHAGALALVDGAQGAPHMRIDVQELDADFYVFSGHKVCGPTGIGVLYAKSEHLEAMPPYQSGGGAIRTVTCQRTTYNDPPSRFEAGTPNIAGAIGLGAAIDYIVQIGMDQIAAYEHELLVHGIGTVSRIPGLRIIGMPRDKAAVISFIIEGIDPHEIGTMLDLMGIAVRTGQHCAHPAMARFGLTATARASIAFYNTAAELDALADGLQKIKKNCQ
jgi:cysteine desulfurase/selenocysteine lyase